ncbi:MAG: tetratricopeptide repeat protein [Bradymonadales bacterium]|nr:tetratricopeptide repeat protein [Bradymonadales bacterium]
MLFLVLVGSPSIAQGLAAATPGASTVRWGDVAQAGQELREEPVTSPPDGWEATVSEGFVLLEGGDPQAAAAVFLAVLEEDSENLLALEGLVWSYLALGEIGLAVEAADRRRSLDPDDAVWREHWLAVVSQDPARHDEVLDEYRALVAARPRDLELRLQFAEFALGVPDHRGEAIAQYREAVAIDPDRREAVLGLAQCLLWEEQHAEAIEWFELLLQRDDQDTDARMGLAQGLSWSGQFDAAVLVFGDILAADPDNREARLGLAQALSWGGRSLEAIEHYSLLLAADGDDVELLLGRARAARWDGDLRLARRDVDRGMALAPADARFAAELAQLELGEGRLGPARRAADRALALDPGDPVAADAQAAIRHLTRPGLGIHETYSEEGGDFTRLVHSLRGAYFPWPDTKLDLYTAWTQFDDAGGSLDRWSLGLEARQRLPLHLKLGLLYRIHILEEGSPTHEVGGELRARLGKLPIEIRAVGRHRALVDAPGDREVVAFFDGVGTGGTTLMGIRQRLQIAEGQLGLTAIPLDGAYVYGLGSLGWIDDDNRNVQVAAGAGVNLFRLADVLTRFDLTGFYDFYYLAYDSKSDLYYSPRSLEVHSGGVSIAWRPLNDWEFGAHASLPMITGGGYFTLTLADRLRLAGRIQLSDQPYYSSLSSTLGITLWF